MENAARFPPLAHRSAAAHKPHSVSTTTFISMILEDTSVAGVIAHAFDDAGAGKAGFRWHRRCGEVLRVQLEHDKCGGRLRLELKQTWFNMSTLLF